MNHIPKEWLIDERKGVQTAISQWQKAQQKLNQQHEKIRELQQIESELHEQGFQMIAGIDEVGRGPLAGPVVAAAIIMKKDSVIIGVNDSKQLSIAKRDELFEQICEDAIAVGIGIVDSETIDEINIYQATKVAMQQAIDQLSIQPDYLLIDAMTLNNGLPQEGLIKGDARSYSIACASIIAKVTRDRMMTEFAKTFPEYGFEKNAGYGTAEHLDGLKQYGVTPIHRRSFEPVKSMVSNSFQK